MHQESGGKQIPPQRGVAAWLMRHIPAQIMINPERVLINFACMLIGLSTLLGQRSPVMNGLWPFPLYEWAIVMLAGGLFAMYGMLRQQRTTDRLGMLLLAFGCTFYAVLIVAEAGPRGLFSAAIFFAIAAAKTLRLLVTSAVRAFRTQVGEAMLEEDQSPGGDPE